MARAIIINRISRRTGVVGIPRATRQEGVRRLVPEENLRAVAKKVLTIVKARTRRDGNDRQVELGEVKRLRSGRHRITTRVLYRVYRSKSDEQVHVYEGPAHMGAREGVEAREIKV